MLRSVAAQFQILRTRERRGIRNASERPAKKAIARSIRTKRRPGCSSRYACCIAAPPAAIVAAVPTRLPYRPYSAQSPPSCSDAGGRREKDPSCTPRVDNHHCRGHGASRHRQCGAVERTGRERLAGLRPDVQRRPLQSAVADQCLHRHAAGTRLVAGPGLADGYLHAYSARTGKDLCSFFCGVAVTGVPIAYRVGDKQYITITSGPLGGASAAFGSISARWGWDPRTHPRRLLTFALDASAKLPPTPPRRRAIPLVAPEFHVDAAKVAAGAQEYSRFDSLRHFIRQKARDSAAQAPKPN